METYGKMPLRIAQVCMPSMGGSSTVAVRLAQQLANRGHKSYVLTQTPSFAAQRNDCGQGVGRVRFLSPKEESHSVLNSEHLNQLSFSQFIGEVAINEHLDVIHVHYVLPFGPWADNARTMFSSNTALMITLHGTDVVNVPSSIAKLTAKSLSHAEVVTAVSDSVARSAKTVYGVDKSIVVPNWAPMPDVNVDEVTKVKQLAKPNEIKLVHVSNFRSIKQATHCVDVLHEVLKSKPARLFLVGKGETHQAVLDRASSLDISRQVVDLGSRSDPLNVISASDFLLLPSKSEAAPLVVLEAATVGVPSVAYPVGGVPELIIHGKTGLLSPVDDPTWMGKLIVEAVDDPERNQLLISGCRELAKELSPANIVGKYEELYSQAMDRRVDHFMEGFRVTLAGD